MADRDLTETVGTAGDADLRRLKDLSDYEVADGYPDITGWEVKTPDGRMLGKVDDLVVSVREMRVRYVDIDVDRSLRSGLADAATPKGAEKGHALVPIGAVQLDDARNDVVVSSLSGTDLASYPLYAREGGISREYEQSLRGRFGTAGTGAAVGGAAAAAASDDFYSGEHFDDSRFFRNRAGSAPGAPGREISPAELDAAANASGATEQSYLRRRTGMPDREVASGGMGAGAADRATSSGPLDRLADKADNVKDRFDGNPASRPGPDATDRPI
jgi:photosynthetic reaction center H subunit